MFDLDKAINEWRQQMLDAGIKTPVPLDELESHLREEVARQTQTGAGAREAFESAALRIGRGQLLKAEFAKIETPIRKPGLKYLCLLIAVACYATPIMLGLPNLSWRVNSTEFYFALAAITLTISALAAGPFIPRWLPAIAAGRTQSRYKSAACVAAWVWLAAFVFILLPRFDFTTGQLLVVMFWAVTPLALLGFFTQGLNEAGYRKSVATNP